jgi:thioredoxin reductase (NADPH)
VYRARADLVEQVGKNPKIAAIFNATVTAISGAEMVQGVTLRHADGREEQLPCAGVFAYIGLVPNADMLPAEVQRDTAGCVKTNEELETSVRGLWAIGAVRSGYGGTLDDAIAEAERVAGSVTKRLAG